MSRLDPLILVGTSVRYLAESAGRSGRYVIAVDGFADEDTRAAADLAVACESLCAQSLADAVQTVMREQDIDSADLIYTSGFEDEPQWLDQLESMGLRVLGNSASTWQTLQSPERFFSLLDALNIPHPQWRRNPPAEQAGWLCKRCAGSGGLGIRDPQDCCDLASIDRYYQRYLPGPAISCTFAADGRDAQIIGFNRLFAQSIGDRPFVYAGAINRAPLSEAQQAQIRNHVELLTAALQLQGINGLDLVLHGDTPYVLELNPRIPASLALYENELPGGGVTQHIDACSGPLLDSLMPLSPTRVQRILYADSAFTVPDMLWPPGCCDLPAAGTRIAKGEPICSLLLEGNAPRELLGDLQKHIEQLQLRLLSAAREVA